MSIQLFIDEQNGLRVDELGRTRYENRILKRLVQVAKERRFRRRKNLR